MESKCPICNNSVHGDLLTVKYSSMLKSIYKFYYSLLVPIPFVGAYLGSKLYDFISSMSNTCYKHLCPNCKCHWIDSLGSLDVKISGNKKLVALFCDDTFIVGAIDNDLYIVQTKIEADIKTTVIYKQGNNVLKKIYINGQNDNDCSLFGRTNIGDGIYIGEIKNSKPNGWGFVFAKNGFLYYGKWADGKKDGVMFNVSLDGRNNNVEYWRNGELINL